MGQVVLWVEGGAGDVVEQGVTSGSALGGNHKNQTRRRFIVVDEGAQFIQPDGMCDKDL